jgi:hypothetical protein
MLRLGLRFAVVVVVVGGCGPVPEPVRTSPGTPSCCSAAPAGLRHSL